MQNLLSLLDGIFLPDAASLLYPGQSVENGVRQVNGRQRGSKHE
jgi:hypothetical protein